MTDQPFMEGRPTEEEVVDLVRRRAAARAQSSFQEADKIRDDLLWRGVLLEDSADGTTLHKELPFSLAALSRGKGCLCWLRRKGEFCGQPCASGSGHNEYFCTQHREAHVGRVPCPLDLKHSIAIAKLPGHLRVCQGRRATDLGDDMRLALLKLGIAQPPKADQTAEAGLQPGSEPATEPEPEPDPGLESELKPVYEPAAKVRQTFVAHEGNVKVTHALQGLDVDTELGRRVLSALWACGALDIDAGSGVATGQHIATRQSCSTEPIDVVSDGVDNAGVREVFDGANNGDADENNVGDGDDGDDGEFDVNTIAAICLEAEIAHKGHQSPEVGWQTAARMSALRLRKRAYEALSPRSFTHMLQAASKGANRKARNAYHDVQQQASIAGHLHQAGWLPLRDCDLPVSASTTTTHTSCTDQVPPPPPSNRVCLIELCAGSAHLSRAISDAAKFPIAMHVLVDRQLVRKCADFGLRTGGNKPYVRRVQSDIRHFDLHALLAEMLQNEKEAGVSAQPEVRHLHVLAVGKHLCGAATDLSIQCCVSHRSKKGADTSVTGLAFAVCCHHRCTWNDYLASSWLEQQGITERDFPKMIRLARLAHSQYGQRSRQAKKLSTARAPSTARARAAAARAELGHLCKRLLDEGRLFWLRSHGWDGRLVRFVSRETSPENVLLLAWPVVGGIRPS